LLQVRFSSNRSKQEIVDLGRLHSAKPNDRPQLISRADLREISQAILHYLKEQGIEGMVAMPHPAQVDPSTGKDLRPKGNHVLDFVIWVARVADVKIAYSGERESNATVRRIGAALSKQMNKQGILGQPLRARFRRTVERLGNSPAKTAQLLLLPASVPGEVEAIAVIRQEKNWGLSLGASNSGSPSTGEWLIGGSFEVHELLRNEDPLSFSWMVSDTGQRLRAGLGYSIPLVKPSVLELAARLDYGSYDGSSFAVTRVDFEGSSLGLDLALNAAPLSWEGDRHAYRCSLGFGTEMMKARNSVFARDSQATFLTPRLRFSREGKGRIVRSLNALTLSSNLGSVPVDQRELIGGFSVEDKVAVLGFSHLGAIDIGQFLGDRDRTGGSGRHLILTRFHANGSLTGDRMLPQVQSILGGSSGVRGYPESVVAGDRSFMFSLEYRWKFLSVGQHPDKTFSLSLSPFFDYGKTFVHDPLEYESDHTLASFGIGLGIGLPSGGQARIEYARPLEEITDGLGRIRKGTTSDDHRVHASTNWKF